MRVDSGAGAANTFATYSGSWALGTDGANYIIEHALALAVINYGTRVDIGRNADQGYAAFGVKVEEDSQLFLSDSNIYADIPLFSIGQPYVTLNQCNIDQSVGTNYVVDFRNVVSSGFQATNTYFEGGSSAFPIHLGKVNRGSFINCVIGTYLDYDPGYGEFEFHGCQGPLLLAGDHNMPPPDHYKYRVWTPDSPDNQRGVDLEFDTTTAADADALTGTAWSLPSLDHLYIWFTNVSDLQYVYLPPGTYEYTVYAKVTSPSGADIYLQTRETNLAGDQVDTNVLWDLTTSYASYKSIVRWPDNGNPTVLALVAQTNNVFVSHITLEYKGPLTPGANILTAFNAKEGDADGDRATSVNFQGFQSGGEQSLLAQITASHDGAADDQKGKLEISVNDTNDGFSPTLAAYWDSLGDTYLTGNVAIGDNSDNDFSITFDGDTSNGVINYDEDNADFEFDQDVNITGILRVVGKVELKLTTITNADTPYSLDDTVNLICNTAGGVITVNLPASSGISGRMYWIKNSGAVANNVTLDGNASETIDGATTYTLTDAESATIFDRCRNMEGPLGGRYKEIIFANYCVVASVRPGRGNSHQGV